MTSALNTPKFKLESLVDQSGGTRKQKLAALATVTLGMIEALSSEAMEPADATIAFFNAENCLWVHRQLKSAAADEIMSRGVQLADLFDVLPPAKARMEFAKELKQMRGLCVKLLRR
jgi:hypothetical protein